MPNLRVLYQKFDGYIHVLSRKMGANNNCKHYYTLRKNQNLPLLRLNKEQKRAVDKAWNGHVTDYRTHELVLSASGRFDPYVCSETLFRINIELALNNFQLKYGFSEKNYFDKMFPQIPMPETVIRNVNGTYLDKDYRPLTKEQAMALIANNDCVIVKPSIENGCGRGVELYTSKNYEHIEQDFKHDFIVQKRLSQYAPIAALNASSINVVRVVSLSLNGKVSPVNCTLRCGASGAITDNSITKDGHGMFVIGVNEDGTLKKEAFYSCGERITCAPNGTHFAGMQLPNWEKALQLTQTIHEALPHFGFIAVDVCFDEDGSPRIMEFNIRGPGVLYYQYANGPLFGNRTQEVIDAFCK